MKEKKISKTRASPVPEYKKKSVTALAEKMKKSKTVLIASTKGLPSSQFQKIKKDLRDKAEILVAKKSIMVRAIGETEKGTLQNLKDQLQSDIALIFSDMDAFELSALLFESQSATKARNGDIAPEDIHVEPGPTDLIPGPAISELGSVGLKVAVENGKLAIKQGSTIVKKGELINEKVAGVMGKLNILPMKVGFIPLAAYDSKDDKIYLNIKIDKKAALEDLRTSISKALGFAVNIKYVVKETISYFISKALMEEKALARIVEQKSGTPEEKKDAA